MIQSMPDVSPAKWHLAHTTWFFEINVLANAFSGYDPFHPRYNYLFNSYYVGAGERHCRPKRGLLSRPTVKEVYEYRKYVDDRMVKVIERKTGDIGHLSQIVETGLNHEQQHQELLLTDIKHVFSVNPLKPVYRGQIRKEDQGGDTVDMEWLSFDGGIQSVGHDGKGFSYDNERPRHRVYLEPFEIASRPVTVGEYLQFMEDGGYETPLLWLSDGWNEVESQDWDGPLYWEKREDGWWMMTLSGMRKLNMAEPVCHVSYYEADAFARWAGCRLPREEEWEVASSSVSVDGNFVETGLFHPRPAVPGEDSQGPFQMFGDVWEWTQSPYSPYPRFRPAPGLLGEYNAKFMANQFVLRGGSCATSRSHIRPTYRNFFPPDARWQFTGIRLARDRHE